MIQEEQNDQPFKEYKGSDVSYDKSLIRYLEQRQPSISCDKRTVIVIGTHKYYNLFCAQLVECNLTNDDRLKKPFTILNPIDLVWGTKSVDKLRFYSSIIKFQAFYEKSLIDNEGFKALILNPLQLEIYYHNSDVSERISPRSISRVMFKHGKASFKVYVNQDEGEYEINGELTINGEIYTLLCVDVRFDNFLIHGNCWYYIDNPELLNAIAYFKRCNNKVKVPESDFQKFQTDVLNKMENHIAVKHLYLNAGTTAQIKRAGFDQEPEKLIFLSDLDSYVMINPVMKYGDTEVPVLTKKQINALGDDGDIFEVVRDFDAEDSFITLLIRQHTLFDEQLDNPLLYFYLHKSYFLDEGWFLEAFETWKDQGITVLGFNQLKGNKLNSDRASVSIQVSSGLNWFNAKVGVGFGGQRASLKQLYKAVKNRTKYVKLDDGTFGIIPEEWLQRFQSYFSGGEIEDENIKIPKVNYSAVTELYDAHMLDKEVQEEVTRYHVQLSDFEAIESIEVSSALNGVLRPYQLQGLSWLNFLDDFNFGGCLADDMGLGKSIQVIAFMLRLREKSKQNTHLLVVPTSLIHNWKEEVRKFAPSIKLYIHHGPERLKNVDDLAQYETIITTYGTLVSDVIFLRKYEFTYVFLDESQNIKNLSSQRYKAARLLKSRNKLLLSGTPLENNTFDIYAQLSFACPGLLGTRSFFRNTYAIPIDKFKNKHSAYALQQKISPFILRRTKKDVATELPEKTEIILYCDMREEQRNIYNAYEREFREYISASREEDISKNSMHVLKGITKLRQICNSPLLIGDEIHAGDSSSKMEMLLEQLRSISGDHKVLVFSQFVSMLDLIKKELQKERIKHAYLVGSTKDREQVINQFQQDEETRVFLISLKAGGTGLNLTAAEYVFIVDPWWNPAIENQAIDRCYRIGQSRNVIAARLICPDTVEEKILAMQQRKASLAEDLVNIENSFFQSLTKGDLLSIVSNN
ncbi:SNF2 helicase associated domain-containing protein [Fulvivirga sp. 29W222]|uniref:SNF2 helicase associated domain-containing protein n=1 Tax=Fulvivirga marina TaxID=2494733 RepID=A0A937KE48_9BACT|nr:DEAD/DEAH box helicase [Fulvivirga marina]MBL6449179.1 SNF2 helicase associated domain-containing protein [Fulvivirga marina]